ncbi:MAG: peptidoglycan/xylan/chitin deacetylase (PgdA/CDA1 family) [Glaciecola sp.]
MESLARWLVTRRSCALAVNKQMLFNLRPRRQSHAYAALLLPALFAFEGCSTLPGGAFNKSDFVTVAQSDEFYVLRMQQGQTPEDIADIFLGNRDAVWQLDEVNAQLQTAPGELIAVPKKPINPTGVYSNGYRTIPILCYHQFTAEQPPSQKLELRAADFEAQLRYLRDNDFQVLSFDELRDVMQFKRPMPAKGVVLTIDDGYASVYDVAWPLLKQYEMRATLFIYTDFIGAGAALNWDEIREMRDSGLIQVESHGKSHTSLAPISQDSDERSYRNRLAAELSASEASFMANLGAAPDYVSYPYGNSSRVIATMLKENGYSLAATVTRGNNGSFVDPFLLHRTMIYDGHTLSDFEGFLRNFSSRPRPR